MSFASGRAPTPPGRRGMFSDALPEMEQHKPRTVFSLSTALLTVALALAVLAIFTVDRLTPPQTPVAVLYSLPLFLAGAALMGWAAAAIGTVTIGLYLAEAAIQGSLLTAQDGIGLAVLLVACLWAVRTGRDRRHLQMLTAELREKAAELEALRLQREAMNSVVAHELRGALSSVVGYSKLLLRGTPPVDPRHALRVIASGSDQLDRLTQDLLDQSALELGAIALNRTGCDVVALVRETVDAARQLTDRHINLDAPDEPVFGEWDPLRLTQVVRNLLGNALKYTGPSDSVDVSVCLQGGWVRLVVSNPAPDVTPEAVDQLFLPYARLDVHRSHSGSGLGLYVTRALVERHGGSISATIEDGAIRFEVRLPP